MIKVKEMHDDTNNPLGPSRRSTNMAAVMAVSKRPHSPAFFRPLLCVTADLLFF